MARSDHPTRKPYTIRRARASRQQSELKNEELAVIPRFLLNKKNLVGSSHNMQKILPPNTFIVEILVDH